MDYKLIHPMPLKPKQKCTKWWTCPEYDVCLELAFTCNWDNWDCGKCKEFQHAIPKKTVTFTVHKGII